MAQPRPAPSQRRRRSRLTPRAQPPQQAGPGSPSPHRAERFSAWLALAGVIVGAALTAIPAYYSNQNTISAQSTLSSSQFLRDQRRDAYTKFIADEQSLSDLMVHLKNNVSLAPGEEPRALLADMWQPAQQA